MDKAKARLQAIRDHGLLENAPEPWLDDIVDLAALVCGTPVAALSFVDDKTQLLRAAKGLSLKQLSLPQSPDFEVVNQDQDEVLIFSDLSRIPVYADSPLVSLSPRMLFYAGAPIVVDSFLPIGTLSVLGPERRDLSQDQLRALKALSKQVARLLDSQKTAHMLQKSEERFKLAIEGTSAGLLDWNVQTNEVHYSDKWKTMLGYADSEIENHVDAWKNLIHPEDVGRVLRSIQDFFAQTVKEYEIEHRLRTKSGSYKWVLTRGTCIRDRSGLPVRMVGWYQDLTEKKEQERLASEQRARLISSEKMASLGTMAGGIAHEINNPIAIISGNAQQIRTLVMKEKLDQSALLKISEKIESTVERIVKIVKGLRTFAKDGEKDPFVSVSVKSLVEETLEFCGARFKQHSVKVFYPVIPEDLFVECRPVPISQVLLNLLNNAFDAIQEVKDVSNKWVRIEVESKKDQIYISVVDCGSGIPETVRKKLMQPFFTTKETNKGTGLGLSLSRGIVESHSGTLFLDSDCPNTRFTIQIPKTQKSQKKAF